MALEIPADVDAIERRQQSLEREMVREAEQDVAAGRVGHFDADATMRAVICRVQRQQVER